MSVTHGASHPRRLVFLVGLGARTVASLLAYLSGWVSVPFDSSPLAAEPWASSTNSSSVLDSWASSLYRWDAFHFAHIAQNGYVYEYEYAFLPGTPTLMRFGATMARWLGLMTWEASPSISQLLVGGFMMALALEPSLQLYQYAHMAFSPRKSGFHSTRFVFRLTLVQTKSPQFALIASLAAAVGTSPATWLVGSYTETFYTFFAIRGIIYCEGRKWLPGAIAFGLATLFRANGILLSGFLVWYMIVLPYLRNKVRSWRLLLLF